MPRKHIDTSPTVKSQLDQLMTSEADVPMATGEHQRAQMEAKTFSDFALELCRIEVESDPGRSGFFSRNVTVNNLQGEKVWEFDALSGLGIDNIPGPTGIEVLFRRRPRHIAALADHVAICIEAAIAANLKSIVFITNFGAHPAASRLLSLAESRANLLTVKFWGPDELQQLVNKHGDRARLLLDNLPAVQLASVVQDAAHGKSERWRADQRALLARLRSEWSDDTLVLFLGAGVSIDAGIPSWNTLLGTLFGNLVDRIDPSIAKDGESRNAVASMLVQLQGSSPLMAARHIRSGLQDDFIPAVRRALYRTTGPAPEARQLIELSKLCDPPRGRLGVRAVVTYNFDDLLERHLDRLHVRYTSIHCEGQRPSPSCLPIYHVHGFIPESNTVVELEGQTLVFSEEGYHSTYNDPYAWSNVIQLNLLSEHTCLFVGLSMTDPNLRRLLEIANRTGGGVRHFALLKRSDIQELSGDNECPLQNTSCSKSLTGAANSAVGRVVLAAHHQIWEDALQELGVRIIWYEHHSDIPALLQRIGEIDPTQHNGMR